MGFHFNDLLLSEHYLSVLYADCMLLAQATWALESGERGHFSLVAVVHSSTAPWHGRMSFLTERRQSLAGSYTNGHLALSGHSHNCWAAVQFSLAFPPGELERGWEEVEVPSDPSILNQLGSSLHWDRPVCWSMRGLKMGKKRFSLPWGLWTLCSFSLISLNGHPASHGCPSSRTAALLSAWTKAPWSSNIPQTSIVPI